jgi:hypothetical protein
MHVAKEFLKTSKRQGGGLGKQQNKDLLTRSSTLVSCLVKAKVFLTTTKSGAVERGFGKQQSKDKPMRSTVLVLCIPTAQELLKTSKRQGGGLDNEVIKNMSRH